MSNERTRPLIGGFDGFLTEEQKTIRELREALGASRERDRHLREAVQDLHDDELEHKNSLPADEAIEERRCCAAAAGAYRRVLRLMDAPSTSSEASKGEV